MLLSGLLGWLSGPLLKVDLPLLKNVLNPFAKSVLIPLGFIAAVSAAEVRSLGSTLAYLKLIVIMKIVKSLEDSVILLKSVTETIDNETKEQRDEHLSMLFATFGC